MSGKLFKNERTEMYAYIAVTVCALLLSVLLLSAVTRREKPAESGAANTPPRVEQVTPAPQPAETTPDPEPVREREYTIELTDAQAAALAALALHDYAENVSAHFAAPDTLELTADILRDGILEYLPEDRRTAAAAARLLLPETFTVTVAVSLAAEDGALKVHVARAEALGADVAGLLPAGAEGKLNDAISEVLPDSARLKSVVVTDGAAILTAEL